MTEISNEGTVEIYERKIEMQEFCYLAARWMQERSERNADRTLS